MSLFISVAVLLVLLLLSYLYWHIKVHDSRKPPLYPGILPFIGHAKLIHGDSSHVWKLFSKISNDCICNGGGTSMFIGWINLYVLTDPHDCSRVANENFTKGHFYDFFKFVMGNGILISDVKTWKINRKLINPSFNPIILDGFLKLFNSQSKKLAEDLINEIGKGPFDHMEYFQNVSLETICLTTLGLSKDDLDTSVIQNYVSIINKTEEIVASSFVRPWMHIPFLFNMCEMAKAMDTASKRFYDFSDALIQKKTKQYYEKQNKVNEPMSEQKFKPFLEMLLELGPDVLTNEMLLDEVNTIVIAGFETTAQTLTNMFQILASKPDMQDKIRNELYEILGDSDTDIEKQDLVKMDYLEAVIKETLRLYPVLPFIARELQEDVKLNKWTLSKGSNCVLSIYGMHRHPAWGADVDKFRPERWLDQTLPDIKVYYAPFGLGRRNCIGKSYAMMFIKTVAAHILRRYKVSGNAMIEIFKFVPVLKPSTVQEISIDSC